MKSKRRRYTLVYSGTPAERMKVMIQYLKKYWLRTSRINRRHKFTGTERKLIPRDKEHLHLTRLHKTVTTKPGAPSGQSEKAQATMLASHVTTETQVRGHRKAVLPVRKGKKDHLEIL